MCGCCVVSCAGTTIYAATPVVSKNETHPPKLDAAQKLKAKDARDKQIREREKRYGLVKKDAYPILTDIAALSTLYSSSGTIVISGINTYEVEKSISKKDAKKWAQEIKGYFEYWLQYWGVKPDGIEISGEEGDTKGEYVTITFKKMGGYRENSEAVDKIEKLVQKLETKKGVTVSKERGDRIVRIDIAELFEYNTLNFKYGAAFILDCLVDVARIYTSNVEIDIVGYKQSTFRIGPGQEAAKEWSMLLGKYLVVEEGLPSNCSMYCLGAESEGKKQIVVTLYKDKKTAEEIGISSNTTTPEEPTFTPVVVYKDMNTPLNMYSPSGWMGDINDLKVDIGYSGTAVCKGFHSMKIIYQPTGTQGWVGIQWQRPNNNWGNMPGGINLTGAKKLTFWARGERGGEKISEVKVGGIKGQYPDSDVAWKGNIVLGNDWKQYEIPLMGKDMSHIIGGFSLILTKKDNKYGCSIYIDEILFE